MANTSLGGLFIEQPNGLTGHIVSVCVTCVIFIQSIIGACEVWRDSVTHLFVCWSPCFIVCEFL